MPLEKISKAERNEFQNHFRNAIKRAEGKRKQFHDSNENDITTSILTELSTDDQWRESENIKWRVQVNRPDFSGKNAESEIGADGIIQIKIYDKNGQLIESKGMLFQAKKTEYKNKKKFNDQVSDMIDTVGEGAASVFIYDKELGFYGVKASEVTFEDLKNVRNHKKLSDLIAVDFFECLIGSKELRYNQNTKKLRTPMKKEIPVQPDAIFDVATLEVKQN